MELYIPLKASIIKDLRFWEIRLCSFLGTFLTFNAYWRFQMKWIVLRNKFCRSYIRHGKDNLDWIPKSVIFHALIGTRDEARRKFDALSKKRHILYFSLLFKFTEFNCGLTNIYSIGTESVTCTSKTLDVVFAPFSQFEMFLIKRFGIETCMKICLLCFKMIFKWIYCVEYRYLKSDF